MPRIPPDRKLTSVWADGVGALHSASSTKAVFGVEPLDVSALEKDNGNTDARTIVNNTIIAKYLVFDTASPLML